MQQRILKTILDDSKWSFASAAKVVTGFTTDGESLNTGSKNGLWVKFQEECTRYVICVWCACHRSSLAYKSMFKEVDDVRMLIQDIRNVATFFRTSGIRTLELQKACDSISVKLLHFPQFKEVRMTEITCDLLAGTFLDVFSTGSRDAMTPVRQRPTSGRWMASCEHGQMSID